SPSANISKGNPMTIKPTSDAVAVTQAGTFERVVSHDEALEAAKALIDGHFNNKGGRGVYISIPAQPDNSDVLLVDYTKQQRALSRLASTHPMPEDVAGVVDELERVSVRTEILNADTGETVAQSVVVSLDLRDCILTALRDSTDRDAVGRYRHKARGTEPAPPIGVEPGEVPPSATLPVPLAALRHQPQREAVLEEAAREVLRLARNPGVAAGDFGKIAWGQ